MIKYTIAQENQAPEIAVRLSPSGYITCKIKSKGGGTIPIVNIIKWILHHPVEITSLNINQI